MGMLELEQQLMRLINFMEDKDMDLRLREQNM